METGYCRRKPGQSFPLLALMIVVIVAVIGLSVDVGNAFGQQRRAQNAANGSALTAMNGVLAGQTNQAVWDGIKRTLAANGIDTKSTQYRFKADYVLAKSTGQDPQLIGQWNMKLQPEIEIVPNPDQKRPDNVIRVQVTVEQVVDTYFARVVGRNNLPVNVQANACVGGYGIGVYPIGVPIQPTPGYHTLHMTATPNTAVSTNGDLWHQVKQGKWDTPRYENGPRMVGNLITLPLGNQGGSTPPGTHIAWLSWKGGNNNNDILSASLAYPGDLQNGFVEGPNGDSSLSSPTPNKQLELQDWVNGDTGSRISNDVDEQLDNMVTTKRVLVLPMYLTSNSVSGKSTFYITKMGRFRLVEYQRTSTNKYLKLMYLGDAPAGSDNCAQEGPEPRVYNIAGTVRVNRVWGTKPPPTVSNDIVIIMDESASMSYDWKDQRNNVAEKDKRITAAKESIKTFVREYDLSSDPEARMAFIEFSGKDGERNDRARLMVNWTTACAAGQIASNCGSLDNKWKSIQTAANNLSPNGSTPGPYALERTLAQLQSAQTRRSSGKEVRTVVLFATDGVFNICGSNPNNSACPKSQHPPCTLDSSNSSICTNNADYNLVAPRPVWQGQQIADQIKTTGASVFVVALKPDCPPDSDDCFNPKGLYEMSSGQGYYYQVSDAEAMKSIYQRILAKIENETCVPMEQVDLAPEVTVRISDPTNPGFKASVKTDSQARFVFEDLVPGQYVITADAKEFYSPEDKLYRTYGRVRNALNPAEEGRASFDLNPAWPNKSTVEGELRLSLSTDDKGVPYNGCTSGYAR
jgi:hypothetical protein